MTVGAIFLLAVTVTPCFRATVRLVSAHEAVPIPASATRYISAFRPVAFSAHLLYIRTVINKQGNGAKGLRYRSVMLFVKDGMAVVRLIEDACCIL